MNGSTSKRPLPGSALRLSVPAKINLWLEVLGKRGDGYHELSSLMLPVDIRDHLEMILAAGRGIRLTCDHADLPVDERNLAWRAAKLFLEATGAGGGVEIRLEKNIPVGAGMGGGSADAAGSSSTEPAVLGGSFHEAYRGVGPGTGG